MAMAIVFDAMLLVHSRFYPPPSIESTPSSSSKHRENKNIENIEKNPSFSYSLSLSLSLWICLPEIGNDATFHGECRKNEWINKWKDDMMKKIEKEQEESGEIKRKESEKFT